MKKAREGGSDRCGEKERGGEGPPQYLEKECFGVYVEECGNRTVKGRKERPSNFYGQLICSVDVEVDSLKSALKYANNAQCSFKTPSFSEYNGTITFKDAQSRTIG